jgi:flagellar motor component MotA
MVVIYDWSFAERLQCPQAERNQCLELVSDLVDLAAKARRLGLLSLVDTIEEEQHFLLQKGLQLIVDGVKPDAVRRILENYILSDNCRGKELLVRCLILEEIAGIQSGVNPKNIKEMLLSFFGSDGPARFVDQSETDDDENLEDLFQKIDHFGVGIPRNDSPGP